MLVLWNEGRVRGMVGSEELRPMREELEAFFVAEPPAERQRHEESKDDGAKEILHDGEVYAPGPGRLFHRAHAEITPVARALSRDRAVVDDAVGEEGIGVSSRRADAHVSVPDAEVRKG